MPVSHQLSPEYFLITFFLYPVNRPHELPASTYLPLNVSNAFLSVSIIIQVSHPRVTLRSVLVLPRFFS